MMNDAERAALAKKLDADLESFIDEKIEETKNRPAIVEDEKTLDELVDELKQHPAFMTHYDETKPMSAALEGLQALKYESESADNNARSYKDDGNKNFERSKYRWAIDNYTAGINCKPTDIELNAVLYTNRAAANYRIGNFRSSLTDCIMARKFKEDHMKAIVRGAMCCLELRKLQQAVSWCDEGLMLSPTNNTLVELRGKADKLLRNEERDKRKAMVHHHKKSIVDKKLLDAIKERGIRIGGCESSRGGSTELSQLSSLESHHPGGGCITVNEDGILHWPVLFLYPEHTETDYITAFNEQLRFIDQLECMFGSEAPSWDTERKYQLNNLQIYFEEKERECLHNVKQTATLLQALQHPRYTVVGGTPCFIILVKDSPFAKQFLSKYNR